MLKSANRAQGLKASASQPLPETRTSAKPASEAAEEAEHAPTVLAALHLACLSDGAPSYADAGSCFLFVHPSTSFTASAAEGGRQLEQVLGTRSAESSDRPEEAKKSRSPQRPQGALDQLHGLSAPSSPVILDETGADAELAEQMQANGSINARGSL